MNFPLSLPYTYQWYFVFALTSYRTLLQESYDSKAKSLGTKPDNLQHDGRSKELLLFSLWLSLFFNCVYVLLYQKYKIRYIQGDTSIPFSL